MNTLVTKTDHFIDHFTLQVAVIAYRSLFTDIFWYACVEIVARGREFRKFLP